MLQDGGRFFRIDWNGFLGDLYWRSLVFLILRIEKRTPDLFTAYPFCLNARLRSRPQGLIKGPGPVPLDGFAMPDDFG
jgi:hypothetical protein